MNFSELAKQQLADYDRHRPGTLFAGFENNHAAMTIEDAYRLQMESREASRAARRAHRGIQDRLHKSDQADWVLVFPSHRSAVLCGCARSAI
jgi:hypothetical protein